VGYTVGMAEERLHAVTVERGLRGDIKIPVTAVYGTNAFNSAQERKNQGNEC
jgi:hypothetical protein